VKIEEKDDTVLLLAMGVKTIVVELLRDEGF